MVTTTTNSTPIDDRQILQQKLAHDLETIIYAETQRYEKELSPEAMYCLEAMTEGMVHKILVMLVNTVKESEDSKLIQIVKDMFDAKHLLRNLYIN